MTEGANSGIREGQEQFWGKTMTLKGAGLLLALMLATGTAAAASPLPQANGVFGQAAGAVQQVRHHYRYGFHRWHGTWRGCPYWYERTFWGAYRLVSPCSNRVPQHAY